MNIQSQKLIIEQVDRKLGTLRCVERAADPERGWVFTVRTALKMSLQQLGNRLGITPQSVKEIEEREVSGSITLKSLREAADALDMDVAYVLVPRKGSLRKMVEHRAGEMAAEIVMRTSKTMELENQEVSKSRLRRAIAEKKYEIVNTMPKYLWD